MPGVSHLRTGRRRHVAARNPLCLSTGFCYISLRINQQFIYSDATVGVPRVRVDRITYYRSQERWAPIYAAVLIATLLLLFLPDPAITQLGLTEFTQSYRTYMGISLIASASLLSGHIIFAIATFVLSPWNTWRLNRNCIKKLAELTNEEKEFLLPFIVNGQNTQYAPINDGVVKGLELKRLIYRASTVSMSGFEFAYNLQPYVRSLLKDRPHLLD
jgi:Super-infection exclusion protein B